MPRRVAHLVVLLVLCATALRPATAVAQWGSASTGSGQARSLDLEVPGTLSASCSLLGSGRVTLTWVGNGQPWSGYEVQWGSGSTSGEVSGTSYTTPPLGIGTWHFTVRAAKGAWHSATSNSVSKTVISVLGIATCL